MLRVKEKQLRCEKSLKPRNVNWRPDSFPTLLPLSHHSRKNPLSPPDRHQATFWPLL